MNRYELKQQISRCRFKINRDTPQGKAWNEYARRTVGSMAWDSNGNWYFPSEWPPEADASEAPSADTQAAMADMLHPDKPLAPLSAKMHEMVEKWQSEP